VTPADTGDDDVPETEQTVTETAESLLAFENAALPLCVVNPAGSVLMVNRALRELLGYSNDELVGKGWEAFIAEDPHGVVALARRAYRPDDLTTSERRVAARRRDGTSRHSPASPPPNT
jgi:PAS domain S-box-containing protein